MTCCPHYGLNIRLACMLTNSAGRRSLLINQAWLFNASFISHYSTALHDTNVCLLCASTNLRWIWLERQYPVSWHADAMSWHAIACNTAMGWSPMMREASQSIFASSHVLAPSSSNLGPNSRTLFCICLCQLACMAVIKSTPLDAVDHACCIRIYSQ